MNPKWNDPLLKAGTMVRTALWLISEVGVGGSFTKEDHRRAFSGISQADRRMRDLRDYGWIIHTSAEDPSLNQNEHRFVAAGAPVWDTETRKSAAKKSISAKQRLRTLAESNYQCSVCGIMGGENYPEAPNEVAVLGISSRNVLMPDGSAETMSVAECKKCKAGGCQVRVDVEQLTRDLCSLPPDERSHLMSWAQGKRRNNLDRLWSEFRRLPKQIQEHLLEALADAKRD